MEVQLPAGRNTTFVNAIAVPSVKCFDRFTDGSAADPFGRGTIRPPVSSAAGRFGRESIRPLTGHTETSAYSFLQKVLAVMLISLIIET